MQIAAPRLSVRLAMLFSAVCMVFLMIGGSADADMPEGAPTEYVVQPGDTLWAIAATTSGPEADRRAVVADIARLSELRGASISPGQILLVPAG